jgi:phosphoglycerate dehydrogenase-like enzyme
MKRKTYDESPVSPGARVNVFVVVPMPPDCIELMRKVDPRVNLIYDETLIPKQRYVADRKGEPMEWSDEKEKCWLEYLTDADVMFGFDSRHMKSLPALAPKLRWIQGTSTGIGPAVADAGWAEHGIVTTSASGIHSTPLAEFVTWAMLSFEKGMFHINDLKRQHKFERYCTGQLRGKTLAIIGLGKVGAEVARQAQALGMRVLGTKRTVTGVKPETLHVDRLFAPTDLKAMLSECDYLVVSVPATPEVFGLVDDEMLSVMKPGAVVINICRGTTVVESALIKHLQSGHLGGAALDVFEKEPLSPSSPLWDMENVIISPHSASCAQHEDINMTDLFIDNLKRFLDGRPLRNVIRVDLQY